MDPLSDVLALLKVKSSISSRLEARGRFACRYPAYNHVKFGAVLDGRVHLWIEGTPARVTFETGDFYLLTNGVPFVAATDMSLPPRDGRRMSLQHCGPDGVVRFGQPGASGGSVTLASGGFMFDDANEVTAMILRHLPPIIRLRPDDPGARSLASLLQLLALETGKVQPGAEVARESLAALVLVQALRVYLAQAERPAGWLGALADPRIGAVLTRLHGDLARRWTVESLAAEAGMSRTAFAQRFKLLVGATPLDYLTRWRMAVARTALQGGAESIAQIAGRIGYQSETAFGMAFKRWTGESPGRFRTNGRVVPDESKQALLHAARR